MKQAAVNVEIATNLDNSIGDVIVASLHVDAVVLEHISNRLANGAFVHSATTEDARISLYLVHIFGDEAPLIAYTTNGCNLHVNRHFLLMKTIAHDYMLLRCYKT